MGNITLNGFPTSQNRGKTYFYADLHLDLVGSYNVGNNALQKDELNDLKLDYDYDAIVNSLKNLFTTNPGEKILNPEYGLNLKRYLFDPVSVSIAKHIRDEIYSQITRFEPRVTITDVKITLFEDVNEYDITIKIDIPTLNINNVSIFGTLNNNGYVFRN
jgi:phage baseplate assembly protein W